MATRQAPKVTTGTGSLSKWLSRLAALLGLWVLSSPFVLTGAVGSGLPMWSNVIAGALILVFAGYAAYSFRTNSDVGDGTADEWSGWLAALAGLWIVVSPFLLTGMITGRTVMWSNAIAGSVALVLGAYAGYRA